MTDLTNVDRADDSELALQEQMLRTATVTSEMINDPWEKGGKIIFIAQPISVSNILDFLIPDSIIPTATLSTILPSNEISIDTPYSIGNVEDARLKSTEETLYGMAQHQHLPQHSAEYNDIYLSINYTSWLDNWANNIKVFGKSTPISSNVKVINNHYLYKFNATNWTVADANINFIGLGFNGMIYIGDLESNDIHNAAANSSKVPNVLEGLIKKYSANGKFVNWNAIRSEEDVEDVLKFFDWFGMTKGLIKDEQSTIASQKSGAGETQKMRIINFNNDLSPSTSSNSETKEFDNGYNKALNYIGCYKDEGSRAIPCYVGTGSIDSCIEHAKNPPSGCNFGGPANVMGIQYGGSSGSLPQCFLGHDSDPNLTSAKKYGKGTTIFGDTASYDVQPDQHTCVINPGNSSKVYGGSWANAVYTVQNTTNYKSKIKIVSLQESKSETYMSKNIKAGSLILEIFDYMTNEPLENSPKILSAPTYLDEKIEQRLIAFTPNTNNSLIEINSENTVPSILNSADKALNFLHTGSILYSSDYLFKLELPGTSLPGIQINLNTNLNINGIPDNVEAGRDSFNELQDFLDNTLSINQVVSFRKVYKLDIQVKNSTLGNIGFIHYDPRVLTGTQMGTIENPYVVSLYKSDDLSGEINNQFEFLRLQGSLNNYKSEHTSSNPVKKYNVNNINNCRLKCENNSNCQAWHYDADAAAADATAVANAAAAAASTSNVLCSETYPRFDLSNKTINDCPDGFEGIACDGGCPTETASLPSNKTIDGNKIIGWAPECGCWPIVDTTHKNKSYVYSHSRRSDYIAGNFAEAAAAPSLGDCFLYENSGAIALKDILQKTAWSSASNDMKHFNIRLPNINSSARNISCPIISETNLIIADVSRPVPGNPSLLMSNQILPDFSTVYNEFYYTIGTPMDANTLCNIQTQIEGNIVETFANIGEAWSTDDQDRFKAETNTRNTLITDLQTNINKTNNINSQLIEDQKLLNRKTNKYNTIKKKLDTQNNFNDTSLTLDASVKDSLLKLTNHSYEYILWTILAIFIIIVALKIARK